VTKHSRIFFLNLIVACSICCMHFSFGQQVQFLLKNVPPGTPKDSIFLAGNFNGWNPADSRYRFDTKGNASMQLAQHTIIEYKCTLGSWQKVEVNAAGQDIGNRVCKIERDTTIVVDIAAWKNQGAEVQKRHTASVNVKVVDTAFSIPQLNRKRAIRVYLPPDYTMQKSKRYPVLYMQDGQNCFDEFTSAYGEWKVDETLDSIYHKTGMSAIVVAIDNGNEHRIGEYNPYDSKFGKGEGDAYMQFVVKSLKPFVDSAFRTLSQRNTTWIAGSSMGGVISTYAVLQYPKVFGGAGIFSPAYWTAVPIFDLANKTASALPKTSLYFYAGEMESTEMVADEKKMEGEFAGKKNIAFLSRIEPQGKHQEKWWAYRFPEFVAFMLQATNATSQANK
jgi:predicted alpha/beta superfamily hydrolase